MASSTEPAGLIRAREIAAIAQTGLAYAVTDYDRERYTRLQEIAAGMLAEVIGTPVEDMAAQLAAETGYPTPKVDVRGLVRDAAGHVLLVREKTDGLWSLPGGWADVNLTPSENVQKELQEEAGIETRAARLLMVLDRARHPHMPRTPLYCYKMFFDCTWLSGDVTPGMETAGAGFFPPDALPPLSIPRILPEQIAQAAALSDDPTALTVFD